LNYDYKYDVTNKIIKSENLFIKLCHVSRMVLAEFFNTDSREHTWELSAIC